MARLLDPLSERDQAVLMFLQQAGRPLSAYDLLYLRLTAEPRIAPTAIYRALDRLGRAGLAERVATLNAWIHRPPEAAQNSGLLAICDSCGAVKEIDETDAVQDITDAAARHGFISRHPVIEVHGQCKRCDDDAQVGGR